MGKRLGIYVTSNQHLEQLVKICEAAKRQDVDVDIFFSHLGCSMMQDPMFERLADATDRMSLCLVCFKEHEGEKRPLPGFKENDFATQERHLELIEDCDRYLNF